MTTGRSRRSPTAPLCSCGRVALPDSDAYITPRATHSRQACVELTPKAARDLTRRRVRAVLEQWQELRLDHDDDRAVLLAEIVRALS